MARSYAEVCFQPWYYPLWLTGSKHQLANSLALQGPHHQPGFFKCTTNRCDTCSHSTKTSFLQSLGQDGPAHQTALYMHYTQCDLCTEGQHPTRHLLRVVSGCRQYQVCCCCCCFRSLRGFSLLDIKKALVLTTLSPLCPLQFLIRLYCCPESTVLHDWK